MSYIIDTYDISDIHDMYDIRDISYIHYIHYIDRRDYHAIDRDITLPLIFNSVENLGRSLYQFLKFLRSEPFYGC